MKNLINAFKVSRTAGLFVLGALVMNPTVQGQTTATTDPVGIIARKATSLLTESLTIEQVQTLHAQNFCQLAPELRPLYLHAVAFQIGHIVAAGAEVSSEALAEALRVVDVTDYVVLVLPDEDEAIIVDALRTVNVVIAKQIAGSAVCQQAIQSGAVKGYISWEEGDWNGGFTAATDGANGVILNGGTLQLIDDTLGDL